MSVRTFRASVTTFADAAVELGPDGTPVAFRIWRPGDNPTDHGLHRFTVESASQLMAEQSARGNLYSIDVDHLSLDKKAPPESHKAVGWHRLEVRADGSLWAVDVRWTDAVRAGLTKDPPEWRYFSPAYTTDKAGEITGYLNTALTNQPATWNVTALAHAARRSTTMPGYLDEDIRAAIEAMQDEDEDKRSAGRAALTKMAAEDGDDEKQAKAKRAKAALAMFGEPDEGETKKPEDDGEKKEASAAQAQAAQRAAADDEHRRAAVAATRDLAATVAEQGRQLEQLRREREQNERETVLASRKDLPDKLVATLRAMPFDLMKTTIEAIPLPAPDPAAAQKVAATSGARRDGDGAAQVRAARLPPAEHEDLLQRMGRDPGPRAPYWDRSDKVFPQLTKEEAKRVLASRQSALAPATGRPSPRLVDQARDRALHQATRSKDAAP